MSYYINMIFSTELTCIPRIVDSYIGNYYSNAVGNALTWVFALWLIFHYVFDCYLNILFKQMHYKQFTRTRLLSALWYCGFYSTAFLYCLGTIIRNNSTITEYRNNLILDGGPIPIHIQLGLGLVGSFFFQSFAWTGIKEGFNKNCLTYFALTVLPLTTYYSRRTELFMSLLALISFVHFAYNILRCSACTAGKTGHYYLNKIFFGVMGLFILIHVIVVPIFFIIPLVYSLRNGLNISVILLSINLTAWWICEAYSNPFYKYLTHWMKHGDIKNARICPNNVLDCCLFPIRDDFSFNMSVEKWEMKQRQTKSIQRRKPKDRGVFVQTLKCMVAIRRKLNKRRTSESSDDSDSDEKGSPTADDPGNEADSSEDESSSEGEEDNEEAKIKREYQEETAKALMEDRQHNSAEAQIKSESGDQSKNIDIEEHSIPIVGDPDKDVVEDKDKKND